MGFEKDIDKLEFDQRWYPGCDEIRSNIQGPAAEIGGMSQGDGTLGERRIDRRGWQLSCYREYYRERRKLCNSAEVWGGKGLGEDLRDEFHERRF